MTFDVSIEAMRGLTFTAVEGVTHGSERVTFTAADGRRFVFYHEQDCCEHVQVQQVDGDPADLVGAPLVMAEASAMELPEADGDSATATFYRFGTVLGYVTIRWLGTSNGYYGEGVSLMVEGVSDD